MGKYFHVRPKVSLPHVYVRDYTRSAPDPGDRNLSTGRTSVEKDARLDAQTVNDRSYRAITT